MAENHGGVSIHLKNTPDLKNSIHSFEKHNDGYENLKDWRGSTYMEVWKFRKAFKRPWKTDKKDQ